MSMMVLNIAQNISVLGAIILVKFKINIPKICLHPKFHRFYTRTVHHLILMDGFTDFTKNILAFTLLL